VRLSTYTPRRRKRTRSAKTTRRREAERVAARIEADLAAGKMATAGKITWADFRERYESDYVSGLADRTEQTICSILGIVERISNPQKLTDMTAARISAFQAKLRNEGASEATIGAYSRHLKAALRWAVEVGMLQAAPKIRMPKKASQRLARRPQPTKSWSNTAQTANHKRRRTTRQSTKFGLAQQTRRRPDSNRGCRICNPMP
jgi:hypothetical protein